MINNKTKYSMASTMNNEGPVWLWDRLYTDIPKSSKEFFDDLKTTCPKVYYIHDEEETYNSEGSSLIWKAKEDMLSRIDRNPLCSGCHVDFLWIEEFTKTQQSYLLMNPERDNVYVIHFKQEETDEGYLVSMNIDFAPIHLVLKGWQNKLEEEKEYYEKKLKPLRLLEKRVKNLFSKENNT